MHSELTGGSARQQRNAAYLGYALASGQHPRLTRLLAPAPAPDPGQPAGAPEPASRYDVILTRVLTGLLAPGPLPGQP